jgi:hypothetical protein
LGTIKGTLPISDGARRILRAIRERAQGRERGA